MNQKKNKTKIKTEKQQESGKRISNAVKYRKETQKSSYLVILFLQKEISIKRNF